MSSSWKQLSVLQTNLVYNVFFVVVPKSSLRITDIVTYTPCTHKLNGRYFVCYIVRWRSAPFSSENRWSGGHCVGWMCLKVSLERVMGEKKLTIPVLMSIEFRKLISQLVILLSGLFWILYHSITMMIMITTVIKNLRYRPTISIIICPVVISNRFPLNLVPLWFVILLVIVEVYILACSPDITSNWFHIWKWFPTLIAILGSFAKLRKATISFVMSIRPSDRQSAWDDSAPTGRIFMKFDIWVFFEKLSRKFKFHYNR
jgi:hypothetical protein